MNWNEGIENDLDDQEYTMPCPHCHAEIFDEAEQCPKCGQYITADTNPFASKPKWMQWLFFLIITLVILTFILPMFGGIF